MRQALMIPSQVPVGFLGGTFPTTSPPTTIPPTNLEMAATSATIAFGAPLRKTTRTAIFLPPLFWTTHQLHLLRVLLIYLSQPNPQSLENQLAISSTSHRSLSTAAIQLDSLNTYWRWCNRDADTMSNYWLSEVVMTIMDRLQKDMGSKYFVKQVIKE